MLVHKLREDYRSGIAIASWLLIKTLTISDPYIFQCCSAKIELGTFPEVIMYRIILTNIDTHTPIYEFQAFSGRIRRET